MEYIIMDYNNDEFQRIILTEEQKDLLDFLIEMNYIVDNVKFTSYNDITLQTLKVELPE